MIRRLGARYLLSMLFLLSMAVPTTGAASARLITDAAPAPVAATSAPGGLAVGEGRPDVAGPSPHFGYTSSVLAALATNMPVPRANLQLVTVITQGLNWPAGSNGNGTSSLSIQSVGSCT
jgi:hypothetical protein